MGCMYVVYKMIRRKQYALDGRGVNLISAKRPPLKCTYTQHNRK